MRGRLSALWFVGLSAAAVALATVVYFGFEIGLRTDLTPETIRQTIKSWGAWGVFGSLAIMIAHSFLPFPAEFVAFANGMTYGLFWGTAITWAGAMLGAFAAFGFSRLFGRPIVVRLLSRKRVEALDNWATQHGARLLLLSRLFPFIAFNLINYAAGLSRVGWLTFAWTTGLGILPLTILMVAFGDRAELMGWEVWLLAGGGFLVALAFLKQRMLRIFHPNRGRAPHSNGAKDPGGGS